MKLKGTKFQKQVWEEIKKFLEEVLKPIKKLLVFLGKPNSSRAVANACAQRSVNY